MRSILTQIILISSLLLTMISPVARADDSNRTESLLLMQALSYRLLGEISFYSLQQGGARYEQRLDTVIEEGNQHLATLATDQDIHAAWQRVVDFINAHRSVAAAMSDVNFITDLEQHHQPLIERVNTQIAQLAPETVERYTRARAQLALEHIVAEYMIFNINVFGGHAVTEMEIQNNNHLLKSLINELSIEPQARDDMLRKWAFVERIVLNYNNTSAHFIVMRTADSVRDGLR